MIRTCEWPAARRKKLSARQGTCILRVMKRTWRNKLYSVWDYAWILLDRFFSTLCSRFSLWWQECLPGEDFSTTGKCSFKAQSRGGIRIGKNVNLLAHWRSNRTGLSTPVLLTCMSEDARIVLGDGVKASACSITARSSITLGNNVCLGLNVRIYDNDFHSLDPVQRRSSMEGIRSEPVMIGEDVFVGANAMILKGVKIGARTIVAAGSVVFRGEYPEDAIVMGNPAQVISKKIAAQKS